MARQKTRKTPLSEKEIFEIPLNVVERIDPGVAFRLGYLPLEYLRESNSLAVIARAGDDRSESYHLEKKVFRANIVHRVYMTPEAWKKSYIRLYDRKLE